MRGTKPGGKCRMEQSPGPNSRKARRTPCDRFPRLCDSFPRGRNAPIEVQGEGMRQFPPCDKFPRVHVTGSPDYATVSSDYRPTCDRFPRRATGSPDYATVSPEVRTGARRPCDSFPRLCDSFLRLSPDVRQVPPTMRQFPPRRKSVQTVPSVRTYVRTYVRRERPRVPVGCWIEEISGDVVYDLATPLFGQYRAGLSIGAGPDQLVITCDRHGAGSDPRRVAQK